MITENHITVTKTARYYVLGNLNSNTRQIWIVLHGFRQSAKEFIGQFEPLASEKVCVIAPEALNRFYLTRESRGVGATWMTREDRLNEIKDYTNYLDTLYHQLDLTKIKAEITALGFSQGASTVTRWVDATQHHVDRTIVYAGEVAPELLPLKPGSGLRKTKNYYIRGDKDPIFTADLLKTVHAAYSELNFTEITFNGGHEMYAASLQQLL